MNEDFMKTMARGVEAKLLQYEENVKTRIETQIDLKQGLSALFKKDLDATCLMINLAQHKERYANTVKELEKVSCKNLVHFKATYWKTRDQFEEDLTFVMQFLSGYHPEIDNSQEYKFNLFSETHDKNIWIQDGPLACYCSHLRAMIYGYLNYEDYTLIVEDDISIVNTERIDKYLQQIPDDWDIICVGCIPKDKFLTEEETFYKFNTDFHSTHFYIIRNRSFPEIFKGLYPITDQVDVLISNMKDRLNIYNIPFTVYQKNIGTHTQNNLHVIFNSPNYDILRTALATIKKQCNYFCNLFLPNNEKRNEVIVEHLMYDVLYEYILKSGMEGTEGLHRETFQIDCSAYVDTVEYKELMEGLFFFVRCCKKGIEPEHIAKSLLNNLLFTIKKFNLHNTIRSGRILKACGFGSTAHVYEANGIILKVYNDKMRWMADNYNNPNLIMRKEIRILERLQRCSHVPRFLGMRDSILEMTYGGESLYDNFNLPEDWEDQIREVFEEFDREGIHYPEFRLQNILVNNEKITFIDYGMAFLSEVKNNENCERFLRLLNILHERFKEVKSLDKRHELINTFFRSIHLE